MYLPCSFHRTYNDDGVLRIAPGDSLCAPRLRLARLHVLLEIRLTWRQPMLQHDVETESCRGGVSTAAPNRVPTGPVQASGLSCVALGRILHNSGFEGKFFPGPAPTLQCRWV